MRSGCSARTVDVSAVLDAKHVYYATVVVDTVDHAVLASPCNVLPGEFTGERLPDSARVVGQWSEAELDRGRSGLLWQPIHAAAGRASKFDPVRAVCHALSA